MLSSTSSSTSNFGSSSPGKELVILSKMYCLACVRCSPMIRSSVEVAGRRIRFSCAEG